MRRLLLLRHAKAVPADSDERDFDRALTRGGRRRAAQVGQYIAKAGLSPDLILCSSAKRTRETLAQVLRFLGNDLDVTLERRLYMATPATILSQVKAIPGATGSAMVIGHNPGMERLSAMLAGSGDERLIAAMHAKFPTSAMAVLEFPGRSWSGLKPGACRLVAFESRNLHAD
jgi:phosphohistidine phosphatase